MKKTYYENGFNSTIQKGLSGVRRFSGSFSTDSLKPEAGAKILKKAIGEADAVVIGAGSGLSTSAGFTYTGARFDRYFGDFAEKYGYSDMYSGGFCPYEEEGESWAYWSRYIYINRYLDPPYPVYEQLLDLVKDKDYFVITTNVDHCFQKAGFDKKRLFYTQGDYGLFQSTDPKNQKTYDNREWVIEAIKAQGFVEQEDGTYDIPENGELKMTIPEELFPVCEDGHPFTMNLRSDDTFVEDEGWKKASDAYADFLRRHEGLKVVYLELGIGSNTPVIVKYPFWVMTAENPDAVYACLNFGEAFVPDEIKEKSICINGDIGNILDQMNKAQPS